MNCPVCNIPLNMMDKQWITIDYCPQCRWVWLDRGELEKLIEISLNNNQYSSPKHGPQYVDQSDNYHKDENYHKKKKDSIWWEIFDF